MLMVGISQQLRVKKSSKSTLILTVRWSLILFAPIDHPDTTSQDTLKLEFGAILTDSDGDTSPSTIFDVNVLDDIPHGGTDGTLALVEGQSQTLQLLTDTITGADGGEIVSFVYNGTTYPIDGNPIDLINTTVSPSKKYGTIVVNADGTIEITTVSTSEFSGQILDSLTYTIKDGDGDTADRTATMALGDNPGHDQSRANGSVGRYAHSTTFN